LGNGFFKYCCPNGYFGTKKHAIALLFLQPNYSLAGIPEPIINYKEYQLDEKDN